MDERREKPNIFYAIGTGKTVLIRGKENEAWIAAGLDVKGWLILKQNHGSSETRIVVFQEEVSDISPSVVPNEFVIKLKE